MTSTPAGASPAAPGTAGGAHSRPSRARRWGRRLARFVVKAFLVITLASLTFNAVTRPPETMRAPSGQDVSVTLGAGGPRVVVHYEAWGDGGSPIVLVHGFAESTVSWSLTAPALARHHRVYAIDLAGAGYSQYSGRYSLADQSALVLGLMDAMHVNRPVVVGHSLGAAVVGELALERPDAIAGVVFADGDAMPFDGQTGSRGPVVPLVMRSPYATSLYRLATRWDAPARLMFDEQCGSECRGLRGSAGERLVTAWMRPLRQRAAEDALRSSASQPMLHLTPHDVTRILVPRGIVWGEEDATSGGSLAVARTNFGDAPTRIVAHAGHLSMVADPEGFANAVDGVITAMHVS